MKIIAFIAAILSAATVATLAFTTVPSIQKQAADNAAAIEKNAEDISSIDNSVDGLNTRLELLETKHLYYHPISVVKTDVGSISFSIIDNNPNAYTKTTILNKISTFDRISPLSGSWVISGKMIYFSYAFKYGQNFVLLGGQGDNFYVSTSSSFYLADIINDDDSTFNDNVNQIL